MTHGLRTLWRTAAACALAAGGLAAGARAQEAADEAALATVTVEADGGAGFFGTTFAQSAATVMKTDTPILDTPRSVSVVTQQQMQERGARTIDQALQYSPGVFAGAGGNDNRGEWVLIRGFEPTMFLDGLQSGFGYYNNVREETFLLESVAVLKGPSGMLYGNGAVGGVVNATSKIPNPDAPNIVELEFGSQDFFQANIDMGGSLGGDGKLLYRLVLLGRDAGGPVDYSRNDARAVMPSLTWNPTTDTSLTLLASYQKNDTTPDIQFLSPYGTLRSARRFASGSYFKPDVFIGEPSFNKYDGERKSLTLFGSHAFNAVWAIGGTLRYAASEVDYEQAYWYPDASVNGGYNPDGTINRYADYAENDSRTWVGDLHATADFALGDTLHQVMFGASFTDGRWNNDPGYAETGGPIDPFDPHYTGIAVKYPVIDNPEMRLSQKSLYAQDRVTLIDRLFLDIGLRYDWIETDAESWAADPDQTLKDNELSTSAALLYAFENGVSPYVSYSESFYQEAFGTDRNGNAFKPTNGEQWEAGVKYQPPGTNSLFTAAVFDITKSNTLVADPQVPGFEIQEGEAKSRGFELGAAAEWRGLSIDAAYTYLDTESEDGDPLAGVPENQASAWLQYDASGRFAGVSAAVGARYVGETFNSGVRTPPVTLYDAMLAYSWDRYRVALNGRNIQDTRYVVGCSANLCYFGDPRTVALTLTAAF